MDLDTMHAPTSDLDHVEQAATDVETDREKHLLLEARYSRCHDAKHVVGIDE
jgi:hypothetical protein